MPIFPPIWGNEKTEILGFIVIRAIGFGWHEISLRKYEQKIFLRILLIFHFFEFSIIFQQNLLLIFLLSAVGFSYVRILTQEILVFLQFIELCGIFLLERSVPIWQQVQKYKKV